MQSLKLSKLQVTNFRNLEKEVIQFGPGINCILGENGNGKTNILEAVHVLITRKSFRKNSSFPQFLSIDGDIPEIYFSSVFDGPEGSPFSFTGKWDSDRHEWYCDGRPTRKKPEVAVLFINPFDSYSFHNTASMRRTWFDQHIGVLNPEYKKVLNKYNTALRFRNALLSKKPSHFLEQIKAMDPELAKYSKILTDSRKAFLLEIQSYCSGAFKEIFSEEHLLEIQLDSKVSGWSESQIYDLLQSNLQKDTLIGHTRYGVHKDDYTLLFDGLNSFDFCSLGQQKMSYLSLLFAYIELFRYKFLSFPIVLIDDVSGELDKLRWSRLINYLEHSHFQVLITTANEKFKEELEKIDGAKRIYVDSGSVSIQ